MKIEEDRMLYLSTIHHVLVERLSGQAPSLWLAGNSAEASVSSLSRKNEQNEARVKAVSIPLPLFSLEAGTGR